MDFYKQTNKKKQAASRTFEPTNRMAEMLIDHTFRYTAVIKVNYLSTSPAIEQQLLKKMNTHTLKTS